MEKDNGINEAFKSSGAIVAFLLPILKFGFVYLPENISNLYVEKGTFFFTSENKGFQEFPEVRFLYQFEDNSKFPAKLVVGVIIETQKYHIFTDLNADELVEVFALPKATA